MHPWPKSSLKFLSSVSWHRPRCHYSLDIRPETLDDRDIVTAKLTCQGCGDSFPNYCLLPEAFNGLWFGVVVISIRVFFAKTTSWPRASHRS
jgi:hypothetical protein